MWKMFVDLFTWTKTIYNNGTHCQYCQHCQHCQHHQHCQLSTLLALAHVLGQILIFASKFSEIREDLCHVVGSSHLSSHVGPICPNAQPTWEAARAEDCFCFCFYVPRSPLWTLWYPTWETARAEDKFLILTYLWVCEESSYKVIYVRNHVTLGNWPGSSWWSLQEYDICCPSNCPKCPRAHLGSSQRSGCLQI